MHRVQDLKYINQALTHYPVVAILGPRQCGKTTLARCYFQQQGGHAVNYFDLEDPLDLQRLTNNPKLALEPLEGLIVIDEIQRLPELFTILRVLVDQKKNHQFLVLGSTSRELISQSSESLAGRIHYMELTPFSYTETQEIKQLWLRGGFPLAYLAQSNTASHQWRKDYIKTFLEQDIPNLGITIAPQHLRRFWMMLAHYHGQYFNASELGNSLDISHNTAKKYLDILSGTFMIRQLAPWFENIGKRQVKSNKIYFRDSGIYHTLLNVSNRQELLHHPKLGASWEGFALEAIIHKLPVDAEECYYWATHNHAELDLLIVQGDKRMGFEIKYSQAPKLTRSMTIALNDLKLSKLTVIYPGNKSFKLTDNVDCIPLLQFLQQEQDSLW